MSITDGVRANLPSGPPPDDRQPGERQPSDRQPSDRQSGEQQYDRTPPQDIAAEQCVLGGMLLSKDAIADVIEILKSNDFYRPAHATIFDAVLDLYGRGEPADPITVSAALADSGDLARIGGAPYLHTLIASVPTAANAAYYARIVGERAVLRRLVEAGTRIVQLGYGSAAGAGRDVDDVVDLAQQAVYDVTERRVSEDFAVLADMLQPTLDEIEAVGAQGGMMTGVPTGFTDLDRLLNGLHAGQLIIVAGRPGLGKALALDTALPTPSGWTSMGEVEAGTRLLAADGRPTNVTHAFEVMRDRPCYEVEFSDRSVIVADGEHLWKTWGTATREAVPSLVTTEQIAATLRNPIDGRPNHAVRTPATCRYIVDVRPVPSVPVRCVTVDSPDHLYLAGPSMVPTHNSTAAMDFARSASVKHNLASAIFSLEMSKVEIVMRLLAAEARVPLHVLRSGQLSDDDWTKLARRMGEISEAPLFVDDTPNMNLMEIRAKARRLRQRHDLKLIVVDYLQLMTSPKRVESRQQEVADLSRGLKLLAKEVECPVIAVSQLNRGPEQRTDKRPQLSDLRESGCLTADTTLLRADTGAPISFATLLREGHAGVTVWSLDDRRRMVAAPIVNVFPSGTKPVYRLTLASGRSVKATANHRFRTAEGWSELALLRPGDRIAVPRRVPAPIQAGLGWTEHRIGLLAHLIGDGCVLPRQPLHYTSQYEANLAFVETAAATEFGMTARRVAQSSWQHTYLSVARPPFDSGVGCPSAATDRTEEPIHQWFHELGIDGLSPREKRLPDALYRASDSEIRLFLRHLWATTAGCVSAAKPGVARSRARVYYATSSRALADGVVHLLNRLGVATRLTEKRFQLSAHPGYHVTVAGLDDSRRFCAEVGVYGTRDEQAAECLAASEVTESSSAGAGTSRPGAAARGGLQTGEPERGVREPASGGADVAGCGAAEPGDEVYWDAIVMIEPLGVEPVYDATVKDTHNFVANGIVAHNSIEQDADVVILLHRDDYYDKESPRAGEADFIVAKHRNGPTDTVTVAAQLHLSRFVDMAIV